MTILASSSTTRREQAPNTHPNTESETPSTPPPSLVCRFVALSPLGTVQRRPPKAATPEIASPMVAEASPPQNKKKQSKLVRFAKSLSPKSKASRAETPGAKKKATGAKKKAAEKMAPQTPKSVPKPILQLPS